MTAANYLAKGQAPKVGTEWGGGVIGPGPPRAPAHLLLRLRSLMTRIKRTVVIQYCRKYYDRIRTIAVFFLEVGICMYFDPEEA